MAAKTEVLPKWVEVRTQGELEKALGREGAIPVCIGDGAFEVEGSPWVVATDMTTLEVLDGFVVAGSSATIHAAGTAVVDAHDRATVRARGRAAVWARDNVQLTAGENCRVSVWSTGGSVVPTAGVTDSVVVEAKGSAVIKAHGDARVLAYQRVIVSAYGRATVCAWDEATVRAYGNSTIYAWGRAAVNALGPVRVEAWQAANVRARGSCKIDARGAATVELRGRASASATPHVVVLRRGPDDRQKVERLPSPDRARAEPLEWCRFHGVDVTNDAVVLYAAVDDGFRAPCGVIYVPGSRPRASDSDDGGPGHGHQLFAHPSLALELAPEATRFAACPVSMGDLSYSSESLYTAHVRALRISGPVYEVDLDGKQVR